MADWAHLAQQFRATAHTIVERFELPLLVDGPSKLRWDWVAEGAETVFQATFTPHEQAARTLVSGRMRSHVSGEVDLESRGLLSLSWAHTPTLLEQLTSTRPVQLSFRVQLCTLRVIESDRMEQEAVNARIIQQHQVVPDCL